MNHRPALLLAGSLFITVSSVSSAAVRLPAIFGDHMVLQQNTRVPIWGWAAPGEKVLVHASWAVEASAIADDHGKWRTVLGTPGASRTAHTIKITASNTVTLGDVLVGEVWVCSGQSNMEWPVSASANWQEELKSADHPNIRLFTVENTTSAEPRPDCKGAWVAAAPDTVKSFSAVGYYFGLHVHKVINVPVGLISADWGGTPAEAWASAEGLAPLRDFDGKIPSPPKPAEDAAGLTRRLEAWIKSVDAADPGFAGPKPWSDPAFDDTGWAVATVPGHWADSNFDGLGWYRTSFVIPDSWPAGDATLELGPIDDCDMTWLNGTLVGRVMYEGEGNWQTPRRYSVPRAALKPGRNTLAIRVLDAAGPGGLYGKAEQLVLRSSTGTALPLAGQWRFRTTTPFGSLPPRPWTPAAGIDSATPTSLYNGMIAPLIPFSIRGVIWYQGESNVGRAFQYRTLFPALINDWRAHWNQGDFPFYFVQIAPFAYRGDTGQAAELREAQAMTLRLPHTGMAVTMDIGNPANIHPADKRAAGERLARWALHQDYGKTEVAFSGPTYKAMAVEEGAIRLTFDHAEGLAASDGQQLSCFTVAGSDQKFVPARAVIEGRSILISAASVPRPVAVRFGWGAADMPNLVNGAGLPASSFRTDDWPMAPSPRK